MRKKWVYITFLAVLVMMAGTTLAISHVTVEGKQPPSKKAQLKLGIDVLLNEEIGKLKGKRVGLITNPTGVDKELNSIVDLLYNSDDVDLVALYGPEHGVRGDAQAGEGVDYYIDEKTGLPVYSLYGKTRKPTPEMLEGVDVLLFDIQDVGARFYTYIYTMAYAMEAAAENNIDMMVLDRPNPISGQVEGPVLEPDFSSFVGLYPIPQRHGMTVGELAQLFNEEFDIHANLDVIKMKNYKRATYYDETDLPWVLPSPNMPTVDTASVYSGTALIEGTNVSEGRGTTKPFELIGASYIDGDALAKELNKADLPGVKFRAAYFTPMFSKENGKLSGGVELFVTDREKYEAITTGLAIVKTIHDMYPDDFSFLASFDNLAGNSWIREDIEKEQSLQAITAKWEGDLKEFKTLRRNYLLYKITTKDLMNMIDQLKSDGMITSDETASKLNLHLRAVQQFEKQQLAEKVYKHMNGFLELLHRQYDIGDISEKGYQQLKVEAKSMQQQW